MLLLIDIDEQLADMFDEDGDYESIAESIMQQTFGIESAEIALIDGQATCVGLVLKRGITLSYVMPLLNESLRRIRQLLWQTSLNQVLARR